MKKINDSTFNIVKTTMRELNSDEINEVGGGIIDPIHIITLTIAISQVYSCFGMCDAN